MISFPPGFDVGALFSDLVSFASPFVPVMLLITAYVVIRRVLQW